MEQMTLFETGTTAAAPQRVPSPAMAGSAPCGNTVGTAEKIDAETAADDSAVPYVDEGAPEEPEADLSAWGHCETCGCYSCRRRSVDGTLDCECCCDYRKRGDAVMLAAARRMYDRMVSAAPAWQDD